MAEPDEFAMTPESAQGKIGPFLAVMLVASTMIGSGVFLLPSSLGAVGSISILSWFAATAGAAVIAGALSWLANLRPGTAGLFSFIGDAFGPLAGFTAAILYWASSLVAAVAIALAITGYASVFVPAFARPPGTAIATLAFVWLLIGANIAGPRFVARMQGWVMVLGLAPVLFVATAGWFWFHAATFLASWNVTGQSAFAVVPRTAVIVFWAFLGIETAIVLSPRVHKPGRDVPIGTLGGLALSAAIYIAASAAIMGMMPAARLAKSSAPFADALAPILGASVAAAIAICAVLKASGTLGATLLLTAETAESDSVLAHWYKGPPPTKGARVSTLNLLLTGAVTSLVVLASASPTLTRQFTIVTNVSVVLSLIVYGAACLALMLRGLALPARQRLWAVGLGGAGAAFSFWLISVSEADLLIWTVCTIAVAMALYAAIHVGRRRAPLST